LGSVGSEPASAQWIFREKITKIFTTAIVGSEKLIDTSIRGTPPTIPAADMSQSQPEFW
jgi:hypothetical protein